MPRLCSGIAILVPTSLVLIVSVSVALGLCAGKAVAARRAQQEPVTNAAHFEDLFEPQGKIELNLKGERLGSVTCLRLGPRGQILLVDGRFGRAFLADSAGMLIRKLTLEASAPGRRWFALTGAFAPGGSVVLHVGGGDFAVFAPDGRFLRLITSARKVLSFRNFVVLPGGGLLAYALLAHGPKLLQLFPEGRVVKAGGAFPEGYQHFLTRFEEGGCVVVDRGGSVYHTDLVSPEVKKYDPDLRLVAVFHRKPAFFRALPRGKDRLFVDPRRFADAVRAMQKVSQNTHLFCLNDSLLLCQFLVRESPPFALQILSTRGRFHPNDGLRYDRPILEAKANRVYVVDWSPVEEQETENPVILVYRLRFREPR